MTESRRLLQHFLAALAYRTQKALRADFADETLTAAITDEQFLQGPLSDAMTHAGWWTPDRGPRPPGAKVENN